MNAPKYNSIFNILFITSLQISCWRRKDRSEEAKISRRLVNQVQQQ